MLRHVPQFLLSIGVGGKTKAATPAARNIGVEGWLRPHYGATGNQCVQSLLCAMLA